MVGAVLAGDGLERVAEIAAAHAGAPVAVIVPRLGAPVEAWAPLRALRGARLAGGRPQRPADVTAEVPIVSGGRSSAPCCCSGTGRPDAGEYLHVAAVAALTEVAVAEARDETEQTLRGSFLEELLTRDDLDPADISGAPRGSAATWARAPSALCADPGRARARAACWPRSPASCPGALAQTVEDKVYALLPGPPDDARRAAAPAGAPGRSSGCPPTATRRRPTRAGRSRRPSWCWASPRPAAARPGEEIGGGTYRLLFRVLASHPEEVRSFYEDTIAPLVRYDEQYSTDLVGTLEAYLGQNCNMNATAQAIHAHRHTVRYRLERVSELSGLDPFAPRTASGSGWG